ncbi:MAG: RidA family protein [Proteobacteria bacterium]|nr:RidA family protein [Pseudomonadota bacterium]
MVESYNPDSVWPPFGAFSMLTLEGDGQIVHLKGQVSLDRDGHIVGKNDMAVQVRQTLQNIESVLAAMGGRMSDILSLTHYATDIEAFMATAAIRRKFFSAPYPATTTVEVARLFDVSLVIEITAIAEIPRDRFRRPGPPASSAAAGI